MQLTTATVHLAKQVCALHTLQACLKQTHRKFQSKWLTLCLWLEFEIDAMFLKIRLKHGQKKHNPQLQNIIKY